MNKRMVLRYTRYMSGFEIPHKQSKINLVGYFLDDLDYCTILRVIEYE